MIHGPRVKAGILQQELRWEMMASRVGWKWAGVIGCQTCLIKLVDRPDLGYGREESNTTRASSASTSEAGLAICWNVIGGE